MHIFKAREWNPLSPGGSLSDIKHLPELRGINPGVWTTVNSYHSNQLSLLHPSSFPLMSPHPTSGFGEMRILGKGRISALLPGCFLFAPSPHAQAFAQHPTRPISYAYLEPPPPNYQYYPPQSFGHSQAQKRKKSLSWGFSISCHLPLRNHLDLVRNPKSRPTTAEILFHKHIYLFPQACFCRLWYSCLEKRSFSGFETDLLGILGFLESICWKILQKGQEACLSHVQQLFSMVPTARGTTYHRTKGCIPKSYAESKARILFLMIRVDKKNFKQLVYLYPDV